jgi:mannose-6-phosphate isomerase-like protein (cupin superfamily)
MIENAANRRGAIDAYIDESPRSEIEGRGVSYSLVNSDMGAENLSVHLNVLRPNTKGPLHYHENAEDVYIVLAGTGIIHIENEERVVGPDQVLFIPPGVRHSVSNPGPGLLKLIEIYSPPAHPHDFHVVD